MCEATANVLAAQSEIGRTLRNGSYPAIKVLASRAGWDDQRFARYFPANEDERPTQLPVGALYTLLQLRVLPSELIDMLLPDGAFIGRDRDDFCPETEADRSHRFLQRKTEAHREDSPAGRDLSDCEVTDLAKIAARKGGAS